MSKPNYPTRTDARMTSGFGYRIHPISKRRVFHFGTDLAPKQAGTRGVPIYAARDGIVTERFFNSARGNTLRIRHTNEDISTGYQHLDLMANDGMIVNVGDHVKQGQRIGTMGTTGGSTGIHLHFEVIKGSVFTQKQGVYLDPVTYLNTDVPQHPILNVDGKWGPATETRWQQADDMAVADGKVSHQWKQKANENIHAAEFDKTKKGSNHIRHIQGKVGVKQDGLCGSNAISAMQRKARMSVVDGEISEVSNLVKHIQRELNAGRSPF